MKKVNLKEEAEAASTGTEEVVVITDEMLTDLCPPKIRTRFMKAKTPAARADLLYELEHNEMKDARAAYNHIDKFMTKLEQWFVQEFEDDQRGVTGKVGRVEIKTREFATVEDWSKFYAHVAKKKEFDLLNKAVSQKAIQARWSEDEVVPGVGKFVKKVISLTGAKS